MSTTPPDRPDDPFGRGEDAGNAEDAFGKREGGMTSGDPLGGGNLGDTYGRSEEREQPPEQPRWQPPTEGQTPWEQPAQPEPEQPPQQQWQPPTESQSQWQQPGAPPPTGQTPRETPSDATTALVLGLVGLLFCVIAAIPAIIIGNRAKKQIDANPGRYSGRGMAQAGVVLGWVAAVIWTLFLILIVIGLAAGEGEGEEGSGGGEPIEVQPNVIVFASGALRALATSLPL